MNKFELYVAGAILIGEWILAKLLIDSHNKQIDALIEKGHGTIGWDAFMGLRERQERVEYNKRWDEYYKEKESQKA